MSLFPSPVEAIAPPFDGIKTVSVMLTPAEFKDGALARVLVPAPGANRMIVPVHWIGVSTLNNVIYSSTQDFRCRYEGGSDELCQPLNTLIPVSGVPRIEHRIANSTTFSPTILFDPRNKAVWCRGLNTITGGHVNDRVWITMAYYITPTFTPVT